MHTLNTQCGVSLPVFAVLTAHSFTESALVLGAELRAGGRKAVFFISALETGEHALTKQVLPQLHLQEMTETRMV